MNTTVRTALVVAGMVAVSGGAVLVYVLFDGAAEAARKGVIGADPLSRLKAAAVDQAVFVVLGYLLMCVGYALGVRGVVRRKWDTPTTLPHLLAAAVLASATLVLVAVPLLFVA